MLTFVVEPDGTNKSSFNFEKLLDEMESSRDYEKAKSEVEENTYKTLDREITEMEIVKEKSCKNSVISYLKEVRDYNLDHQPNDSVLKQREIDRKNLPLSLTVEKGRCRNGVRQRFFTNLTSLYEIDFFNSKGVVLDSLDFRKYSKLAFLIRYGTDATEAFNGCKMLKINKGDIFIV